MTKKIMVVPKPGMKARFPLFQSPEALYAYMSGQATVAELVSQMFVIDLDGKTTLRAIVEWTGIDPGPKTRGRQTWMRIVRGVVETGTGTLTRWEPFYGWCHPGMLEFKDWEDANAVYRRCDDDATVDIDAALADGTQKALSSFLSGQ